MGPRFRLWSDLDIGCGPGRLSGGRRSTRQGVVGECSRQKEELEVAKRWQVLQKNLVMCKKKNLSSPSVGHDSFSLSQPSGISSPCSRQGAQKCVFPELLGAEKLVTLPAQPILLRSGVQASVGQNEILWDRSKEQGDNDKNSFCSIVGSRKAV